MIDVLLLLGRGFIQVAPVAASTYFVSHDRPVFAVAVGWWISFVWWWNAGSASHLPGFWWACAYATGAAMGTWAGQALARVIARRAQSGQDRTQFWIRESRLDCQGVEMNTGD